MKRISLVLALTFVFALSSIALGHYDPRGVPLPENAQKAVTFEKTESGDWIISTNAESYNSLGTGGHCNRECWDVVIHNHVSVAQWIDWSLDGTRKDWRVLKPGTYASDSMKATIRSNNDVLIRFWAEDPVDQNPETKSPPIAK